jgi:hypothetical protein
MSDQYPITLHLRTDELLDANPEVYADGPGCYRLMWTHCTMGDAGTYLRFERPYLASKWNAPPLTPEILLAVIIDYLEGLQKDPKTACHTYPVVLFSHLRPALSLLKSRSDPESLTVPEPLPELTKLSESKAVPDKPDAALVAGRLTKNDQFLMVPGTRANRSFEISKLATAWSSRQDLESAIRVLDPPITNVELDFLGTILASVAGRNGLAELTSALNRS